MFDGVSLVKTTSEAPESQGIRKRIEEAFSWARTVARFAVFAKSPCVGCLASWLAMNSRLLSISAKSVRAWSTSRNVNWR